jgi:hypothetical protein
MRAGPLYGFSFRHPGTFSSSIKFNLPHPLMPEHIRQRVSSQAGISG